MKNIYTITILCVLFKIYQQKKISHPVPTFFHRKHHNGSLVDMQDRDSFNKVLDRKYSEELSNEYIGSVISISPNVNLNDQHKITISWKIQGKVSYNDWIGLFCPHNDNHTNVLDYIYTRVAKDWFKGKGSFSVNVFNLRSPCEFRYYQYEKAVLVATSKILKFKKNENEPVHGHISMTNNAGEMRVMWISNSRDKPTVYYGLFEEELILKAYGTSQTYNASQLCEFPANNIGFRDPGIIHDVLLKVLLPNTRYYYKFGSGNYFSDVYNFTTPLPAGDATEHKVLTFGDHGVVALLSPGAHETSKSLIKEIRESNIRMILHNGDISYAMGYAYIWDQWSILVEPYSTLVPYMVSIGNHEQDHLTGGSKDPSGAGNGFHPKWGNFLSDSGGECGVPMYYRFHMPDNGNAVWWYSYDFGLVHYIVISTENDFSPNSTQYKWLEQDLKNVDRKLTPWLIVTGHRPMYFSQAQLDELEVALNMQRLFEDLLYKYQVDLCLWAHVHSYERSCKLYKNKCQEDGIVHIVHGTAGRAIDLETYFTVPWSVFRAKEYGFGRITVYNSTQLTYDFLSSKDRSVLDTYTFLK